MVTESGSELFEKIEVKTHYDDNLQTFHKEQVTPKTIKCGRDVDRNSHCTNNLYTMSPIWRLTDQRRFLLTRERIIHPSSALNAFLDTLLDISFSATAMYITAVQKLMQTYIPVTLLSPRRACNCRAEIDCDADIFTVISYTDSESKYWSIRMMVPRCMLFLQRRQAQSFLQSLQD